uniref:Steroid 5-alpha-reductase DET2 n=1 Tax=Kalanchoe fedtschenkoi TaxID=63787 RepID=A0A7N1A8G5_KALFE
MAGSDSVYTASLAALFLLTPPTYISLRFLQAPYGKHHRPGWGPTIPAALAWFLMESPTLWLTLFLFPRGRHSADPRAIALISPYLLHYFHRTVLYPVRLLRHGRFGAPCPVLVAALAFGFNCLNAYVQARTVSHYYDYAADEWFWWRFAAGLVIFVAGMRMNVAADAVLVGLKSGGGGYKIPRGGWFEAVSCPNYLGEIVEWLGWAVMAWSWAGVGFLLYTCANLVPRARASHVWYLEKFKGKYPKNRRAVIPYLY